MIRDIDFFAPYKGQVKEKKNQNIYTYSIIITLSVIILGTLAYNTFNVYKIEKQINDLKTELSSPGIQASIREAEVVNKTIEILGRYNTAITSVTSEVGTRDLVSTELLNSISSTLPTAVSFNNINITPGNVSISAISKTRTAIAEVQHNLKELPQIESVYIGSISDEEEGEYAFELKCVLKGVN